MKKIILIIIICTTSCTRNGEEKKQDRVNKDSTPWFKNISNQSGIDFSYYSGATGKYYIIETMSGGISLFDYDNDNDLDIYVTQGNKLDSPIDPEITNQLFKNDGTGKFTNVTLESNTYDSTYSVGVTTGDYNNDGHIDIYIANYGRNKLLKNNGDGTFTDKTEFANVGIEHFSACASFIDIDNDNDLDLFVTNYLDWSIDTAKECFNQLNRRDYCSPQSYNAAISDTLYLNNGNGTFTDISKISGITSEKGTGMGIGAGDVNKDGYTDIFVANDGMKDHLWINQGNNTFINEALIRGCSVDNTGQMKASMGVALTDIDNDDDLDLYVTTLFGESDCFFLNTNGQMIDSTSQWGLAASTRSYTGWAIISSDFNNDGDLDLYQTTGRVRWQADQYNDKDWLAEPNLLFKQINNKFELVQPLGGTNNLLVKTSHGCAAGDINSDGYIDLIVVNKDENIDILENVLTNKVNTNWIRFDIRNIYGSPDIGTKVLIIDSNGKKHYRNVETCIGYASSQDHVIHVGLGTQTKINELIIYWKHGTPEIIKDLKSNKTYKIMFSK